MPARLICIKPLFVYYDLKPQAPHTSRPLPSEQNMNIMGTNTGGTTMLKRLVLTGMVEFMAFGMLFAAVGAWAIALAPVR
jgi:hypothetical protein